MARKVSGAVVLRLLLVALLLSSSAGADASAGLECWVHTAKNPSCGIRDTIGHAACGKECKSEGYHGWICIPECSCLLCPALDLVLCPERDELRKRAAGNRGAPAAAAGAV